MVVTRGDEVKISIKINGKILEQVKSFKYLGQIITDDGKLDTEVKSRIAMARNTFAKLKDVVTARKLKLDLRKRIMKCYVISTLLYGAETWTLNKDLMSTALINRQVRIMPYRLIGSAQASL